MTTDERDFQFKIILSHVNPTFKMTLKIPNTKSWKLKLDLHAKVLKFQHF